MNKAKNVTLSAVFSFQFITPIYPGSLTISSPRTAISPLFVNADAAQDSGH